jgi:hypothetical protein
MSGSDSDSNSGDSSQSDNSSQGSGDSSQGSGDSSQNSNDSSQGSADSSRNSGNSTQNSLNNTENSSQPGGSSDPQASSRYSSDGTTRESGQGSAIVAGAALLLSTAAGVGLAIYATVRANRRATAEETATTAMTYLKANAHQLRQDLALGAGPTLDDLAQASGISTQNRAGFARALQRHRRELLSLAKEEGLSPERALAFLSRVGELAYAEPALRPDVERFLVAN